MLDNICPLCNSTLNPSPPSISDLRSALLEINNNLIIENKEMPDLQLQIQNLEKELGEIRTRILDKQREIELAIAGQSESDNIIEQIIESNRRVERILGEISLYIRLQKPSNIISDLRRELETAQDRVLQYQQIYNMENIGKKIDVARRLISAQMSEWANSTLQLEHKGVYSLDIQKLTVIVDKTDGESIPMSRMGGRSNWLGCHLVTLLALHKHFIENKISVPNFIFLDQPAQVYFPSQQDYESMEGLPEELTDSIADTIAVNRLFEFLFDVCDMLPNFQIIITEHAYLQNNKRFKDSIIRDGVWRGGKALIPMDWFGNTETQEPTK